MPLTSAFARKCGRNPQTSGRTNGRPGPSYPRAGPFPILTSARASTSPHKPEESASTMSTIASFGNGQERFGKNKIGLTSYHPDKLSRRHLFCRFQASTLMSGSFFGRCFSPVLVSSLIMGFALRYGVRRDEARDRRDQSATNHRLPAIAVALSVCPAIRLG
jgi:hypothetical protein